MPEILSSYVAQFFWGLSAFVVFALILYRVAVKQVLAAVDGREAKIARELKESEDAYAKAKGIKEELDAKLRGCELRIAELMAEARRNAAAHKEEMVEKGRQEIEAQRIKALREIEAARHGAIVDLRAEVAEVSILVAEKAIRGHLDGGRQVALVEDAITAAEARRTAGEAN